MPGNGCNLKQNTDVAAYRETDFLDLCGGDNQTSPPCSETAVAYKTTVMELV